MLNHDLLIIHTRIHFILVNLYNENFTNEFKWCLLYKSNLICITFISVRNNLGLSWNINYLLKLHPFPPYLFLPSLHNVHYTTWMHLIYDAKCLHWCTTCITSLACIWYMIQNVYNGVHQLKLN